MHASAALAAPQAGEAMLEQDKTRPSLEETRAIAEEGFVYGLPIVMNYAVRYDFTVDRSSSQYKGPLNQMFNEARVFTYKDTSVVTPNSDTPYSMLWLDLRASEAAGPKGGAGDRLPEDRQGAGQDQLLRVPGLRAAIRPLPGTHRLESDLVPGGGA
jgi:Protein of unknown function (DUF1254)